jgi:predicted DNA-binding transcriptional regulator AlpA
MQGVLPKKRGLLERLKSARVQRRRPKIISDDALALLNKKQLAEICGVNCWTIDRWRRDRPDFPKPVWLSDVIMRWRRRDVEEWLASLQQGGLAPVWNNGNQRHKGTGR